MVGAGLAGLTAAGELARRGVDVVVLEARDRVGGRCHTVDGVDMGAHWIHGTEGNPVTTLARRHGLPTVFVGGDSTFTGGWEALEISGPGGIRFDGRQKLQSVLAADDMWDALEVLRRQIVATGSADMSLREALEHVRSVGQHVHDEASLDWHLELLARDDAGCGSDNLSLRWWDEGVEVYGYGDSIIVGGYQALAARMAEGLDVRLGSAVAQIDTSTPGRAVVVTAGDSFVADAVVVTVPLGVLKAGSITFSPPLPSDKQAAIDHLGVGLLAKVVMRFGHVWWSDDPYVTGVVRSPATEWPTVIINVAATDQRQPALVLLAGGELGQQLEDGTVEDAREWGMKVLRVVFGPDVPEPAHVDRTSWARDPWSRGGYCAMVVGSSADDLAALAEPVGDQLFFAGEATSTGGWSTAHGAVGSGLREAARILGDPSIAADRFISETRRWRRQQQRVMRFHAMVSDTIRRETLDERLALMRLNGAFDDVPPGDLAALASMFEDRPLEQDDVVCTIGDTASEIYIIASGDLDVTGPDGTQRLTMHRGEMFGELGLFVRQERTANVIASTRCELLVLDYERFRRFLLAFPEAALAVLGASISRLTLAEASTDRGLLSARMRGALGPSNRA